MALSPQRPVDRAIDVAMPYGPPQDDGDFALALRALSDQELRALYDEIMAEPASPAGEGSAGMSTRELVARYREV